MSDRMKDVEIMKRKEKRKQNKKLENWSKAKEIFIPILQKYNYDGATDIIISNITDEEKIQVYEAWKLIGYSNKTLCDIVGGIGEFYRLKLNEKYNCY